jgi:hypothetical protein
LPLTGSWSGTVLSALPVAGRRPSEQRCAAFLVANLARDSVLPTRLVLSSRLLRSVPILVALAGYQAASPARPPASLETRPADFAALPSPCALRRATRLDEPLRTTLPAHGPCGTADAISGSTLARHAGRGLGLVAGRSDTSAWRGHTLMRHRVPMRSAVAPAKWSGSAYPQGTVDLSRERQRILLSLFTPTSRGRTHASADTYTRVRGGTGVRRERRRNIITIYRLTYCTSFTLISPSFTNSRHFSPRLLHICPLVHLAWVALQ